jgi:ankyrin repeat protein
MRREKSRIFLLAVFLSALLRHSPECAVLAQEAQGNSGSSIQAGDGSTIHRAARTGDLILLGSELQRGVNPNSRDDRGRTPLIDAVSGGHLEAVHLLLSSGAEVNARTKAGGTALIEAAARGRLSVTRELVKSGADLNVSQRGWGTALETAERTGHNQIAAMLRQAGARSSGRSPGDKVCVRPWDGNGYCGTVLSVDKTKLLIRVTEIVGCKEEGACPAKEECSAGQPVGGARGINVGDEIPTVNWCLTHTGVKP